MSTLSLSDTKYRLHTVVVLSILDHYKRRKDSDSSRVIGTLLGERKGNEVFIKSCFPVPHTETEDQVVLSNEHMESLFQLHKKVNPNEVVVGWYSTGDNITYTSTLVHQVYRQKYPGDTLVHLTVDVKCTANKMAIKAYVENCLKLGKKSVVSRFDAVPVRIFANEAEKIGIDALINGQPDDAKLDAPASIWSDFDNLERSMGKLLDLLESLANYTKKIAASGGKDGDPEIGRAIANALGTIPHMDSAAFEKLYSNNVQDLIMVIYLAKLTTTQLSLADKMNSLL